MNRIDAAFRKARENNRACFMPFIAAGDPDLETTEALIEELASRGADLLELGIPYSAPMADGPTIQAAFTRALAGGLKVGQVFDMVSRLRARCDVPILTMVSFSIVSAIGPQSYLERAAQAGLDGVIIPDLPVEEGLAIARMAEAGGLHPVFLVAPTTPEARMKTIARRSRGFIYYVSVAGTTGARNELPADLPVHVARLKTIGGKPVAVGFGVSRPDQVAQIARFSDGVIVGSAIVRRIAELAGRPRAELLAEVGALAAELAAAAARAG